MELKEININVIINGNDYGTTAIMPAADADALVALYNKARETVLQGVEEEDQYKTFDPWLKEQNLALYQRAMNAFLEGFSIQLNEPMSNEEWEQTNKYMTLNRDIDGVWLDDDNEILFDSFVLI